MSLTRERSALASFQNFAAGFEIVPEAFEVRPITTGFLHRSYSLTCEANGTKYVFQKLSPIFDLQAVNANLKLFEQAQAESRSFLPEYWQPVHYLDVLGSKDKIYYDEDGNAWRAMVHLPGEIRIFDSFSEVPKDKKEEVAHSLGESIAIFDRILTMVPQDSWQEPLPNFHNAAYHYHYLHSILNNKEVVLSLCHDQSQKVSVNKEFLHSFTERIGALLAKIEKRENLVSCLDRLGRGVAHGDLKINNAVFREDGRTGWRCIALIDLDTIQKGGVLDDLGDALRSAGNPAGEQPESLDLVRIDQSIVENLIGGYLGKISEFFGDKEAARLRKYSLLAYAQFLYVQGIRFFADSLVGNRYYRLEKGERENLNLYRAEVQIRALEELEK